ncbi:MAG: DUF2461 domain-containing protein [Flavobacterium sp.]
MNEKKFMLEFLKDLRLNNSKEWMDNNRRHYDFAKDCWLTQVNLLLYNLSDVDEYFSRFKPKDTIFRINNNRRFNPDLPVYKDYFGFSPMDDDSFLHRLHISIGASGSFVGSGLHRPAKDVLTSFRHAIIENDKEFKQIIENPEFLKIGSISDDPRKLKLTPKGFPKDHDLNEILKYNNILCQINISDELFISDQFIETVIDFYQRMRPLHQFILKYV